MWTTVFWGVGIVVLSVAGIVAVIEVPRYVIRTYYENYPVAEVLTVRSGNDSLTLSARQSFAAGGIGDEGTLLRYPLLYFNGKLVSEAMQGRLYDQKDLGLPIDPKVLSELVIKTFHAEPSDASETGVGDWTIIINPKDFSRKEFDRIVSCYETHRTALDSALKSGAVQPWWLAKDFFISQYANRFSHFIYGVMPPDKIFSTQHPRGGMFDDGLEVAATETLTISYNGKWRIDASAQRGTLSMGGIHGGGNIVLQPDSVRNSKPILEVEFLTLAFLSAAKNTGDAEYLSKFVDDQGVPLTEMFQLRIRN